ncbi:hypothetical protein DMUE_0443 [Dictyocoela muelleri]|nr:hypothetical protein DMUE_0443 [Dictyocoela muelleri]
MSNLPNDMILGSDFLENNEVIQNFKDRIIDIDQNLIEMRNKNNNDSFSDKKIYDSILVNNIKDDMTRIRKECLKLCQTSIKIGKMIRVKHEIRLNSDKVISKRDLWFLIN